MQRGFYHQYYVDVAVHFVFIAFAALSCVPVQSLVSCHQCFSVVVLLQRDTSALGFITFCAWQQGNTSG